MQGRDELPKRTVDATSRSPAVVFHEQLSSSWDVKYTKPGFRSRCDAFRRIFDAFSTEEQLWLDAGCGSGRLSRLLAERGAVVHGLDAAPGMIASAEACVEHADFGAGCKPTFSVVESIEALGKPSSSCDGIVCSSVLEYLDFPFQALDEFYRVLKPGGVLVVSIPNRKSLVRRVLKVIYFLTTWLGLRPWPEYLALSRNAYACGEFWRALETRGFVISHVEHFSGIFPWVLKRMGASALLIFVARRRS